MKGVKSISSGAIPIATNASRGYFGGATTSSVSLGTKDHTYLPKRSQKRSRKKSKSKKKKSKKKKSKKSKSTKKKKKKAHCTLSESGATLGRRSAQLKSKR